MRVAIRIAAICLLSSAILAQDAQPAKTPKTGAKLFVGTWKLVSSQETLANGTVQPYGFGPHPAGMLMYDAKGNMCAQVVNTDRPKWKNPDKPTSQEIQTAFDGFGGYCGTYTVDETNGTMAHHPEISFDPNLVNQPKPRNYRFEGNRLIYSGTEPRPEGESKWVMVWERVK